MIYPNGAVKIIDRAKNIFKLSQGEYIAPEKLENVYIQSHLVAQIWVHGDSLNNYLVAIVTVEPPTIKKWAQANDTDHSDLASLLKNDRLEKAILDDLNRLATENKFSGLERIK
jgi:long-chain acyl-CoA synthetase